MTDRAATVLITYFGGSAVRARSAVDRRLTAERRGVKVDVLLAILGGNRSNM